MAKELTAAAAESAERVRVWITAIEAAERARCGPKLIYREAKAQRLRHAIVGGRRALRFKPEWIDEWLERAAEPVEITPLMRRVK